MSSVVMIHKIINPKISVIVTFFSGVGLVAIVSFSPLDKTRSYDHKPHLKKQSVQSSDSFQNFMNIKTPGDSSEDGKFRSKSIDHESESVYQEYRPLYQERLPLEGERVIQTKNDRISIFALIAPAESHSRVGSTERNFALNPWAQSNNSISALELNYAITGNVSAIYKSVSAEFYDRERKNQLASLAGIKVGNDRISANINTGKITSQNNDGFTNASNGVKDRNLETDPEKKIVEYNTNISPVKNLKVGTSIYNYQLEKDKNGRLTPDGGRVSVLYGARFLFLDLRYGFNNTNSDQKATRQFDGLNENAAMGLTVFLDPNKQYSLYLGNSVNHLGIHNGNVLMENRSLSYYYNQQFNLNYGGFSGNSYNYNSFAASFRGRPKAGGGTTIFFNFRNFYTRDTLYSTFGPYRIPVSSQVQFDYTTALGLEMQF